MLKGMLAEIKDDEKMLAENENMLKILLNSDYKRNDKFVQELIQSIGGLKKNQESNQVNENIVNEYIQQDEEEDINNGYGEEEDYDEEEYEEDEEDEDDEETRPTEEFESVEGEEEQVDIPDESYDEEPADKCKCCKSHTCQ